MYQRLVAIIVAIGVILIPPVAQQQANAQQEECHTFLESSKMVCGSFLTYWKEHGSLAQQGLPITSVFNELSAIDGKTYTVQYFERAVFELHPENKPPYDVLLSLLGALDYQQRFPGGAPGQKPNEEAGSVLFKETGKRVGGVFLSYWQSHGGLMQQGYPISDEFQTRSPLDGKIYTVQYFERAVFELHPENKPPFNVLLSQLGTFQLRAKYPGGDPGINSVVPTPTPIQSTPYDAEEDARSHPSAPPPEQPVQHFLDRNPGTEQRKCVDVERHEIVRSGEFVAGDFRRYIDQWRPNMPSNEGKIWWVPLHQDKMGGLKVRAFSLDDSTVNRMYYFPMAASSREGRQFYPSGIPLPTAGRWRLVATSGPDWGCFDVTVGR